jgi:hypothetical protein
VKSHPAQGIIAGIGSNQRAQRISLQFICLGLAALPKKHSVILCIADGVWRGPGQSAQSTKDKRASKSILPLLLQMALNVMSTLMAQNKSQFIIILRRCKHR